jgi:hypothetical protein
MEGNSKLLFHCNTAPKQCNSCLLAINSNEAYIGCNGCYLWFHISCKIKMRNGIGKISKMSAWFCSAKCEEDYNKISSLKAVTEHFQLPENPSIKDLCQILIQHIENSNHNIFDVKKTIAEKESYNNNELQYLRNEINVIKQQQLENSILVSGIPLKNDTDTLEVLTKINSVIKSTANLNNIYIEKKEILLNQQKHFILRVDFHHHNNKRLFMDSFRSHGPLFLHQILQHGKNDRIFIHDELTPFYNKLSYECRKLKKEFGYKFCWFKNGKVLLRKAENSKIYSFRSFLDLDNHKIKLNSIRNNIKNNNNFSDASSNIDINH